MRLIGRQCLGCMAWYAAQRVIWLLIGVVGAFWLRRNLLRLFSGCLWGLRQPENG
nr:hypothetical protein [uncultured Kingella sp.]